MTWGKLTDLQAEKIAKLTDENIRLRDAIDKAVKIQYGKYLCSKCRGSFLVPMPKPVTDSNENRKDLRRE